MISDLIRRTHAPRRVNAERKLKGLTDTIQKRSPERSKRVLKTELNRSKK